MTRLAACRTVRGLDSIITGVIGNGSRSTQTGGDEHKKWRRNEVS
jgi:hypothetical protein